MSWIGSVETARKASQLRRQALEAGEAGDNERARELLAQAASMMGHGEDAESSRDTYNQAIGLANEGKYLEAVELFDRLAETATQPDLKLQAANLAKELRQRIAYNQSVDLYNRAVQALNDSKLDEAESLLKRLMQSPPEGELRMQAERLLREIRRVREQ
jgi:outer membrane protein assembly factor BamD (BamD/ComL family)